MKLKIEFSFGIEFKSNGDALLGHEQRIGLNSIIHKAVELFGGCTQVNTVFVWRNPVTKKKVVEAGYTISVHVNYEMGADHATNVMVQQIKDSLQQAAVGVTRTEVEFGIL